LALGERRLVVVDQRDDVSARNVAMIDEREAGRFEIEADVDDLSGRNGGADRARVQQTGERDVVDVARGAGHLLHAFFAKDVAADRSARLPPATNVCTCDPRHPRDYMSPLRRLSQAALDQSDDGGLFDG